MSAFLIGLLFTFGLDLLAPLTSTPVATTPTTTTSLLVLDDGTGPPPPPPGGLKQQ